MFAATGGAGAAAPEVNEADLAALRYFLSINDAASAEAEIERLQEEFPGADIEGTIALIDEQANQVDTSPIWRRIEADEFDAARALIAETEAANPGWTPPEDMRSLLDTKEGQAKFETAFAAGDLAGAIGALATYPTILTCDRINNPWRLAEMQVAAELPADALATYDGILRTCTSEDFVVATLQKASEFAEADQLDALFGVARSRSPMLSARLDTLETELNGSAQSDGEGATGTASAAPAPSRASSGASGAATASGGAQATRAKAAADAGDWSTCLALTANARTLDTVNQRAWCAFNYGRPREALDGFSRVAAGAGGSSMGRDATYGMILAYAQTGQLQQAAALASRASLTAQQRRVVNQSVVSKLAVASFENGRYRTALTYLDRLSRESGGLDRGLAMMRGWALLKSGQTRAAREQFRRVHAASPGEDSLKAMMQAR
jgi:cellulose synthase operon protein C